MAEIASISSSGSSSAAKATGFSAMNADDFSKIIFAELSKQDPLQPNDTNALLQQISTLRSIQSGMDLSSKLSDVVKQNEAVAKQSEFASAATLVGKFVGGFDSEGDRVSGQVRSISKAADGATLELVNGKRIALSSLDEIRSEAAPQTEGDRP